MDVRLDEELLIDGIWYRADGGEESVTLESYMPDEGEDEFYEVESLGYEQAIAVNKALGTAFTPENISGFEEGDDCLLYVVHNLPPDLDFFLDHVAGLLTADPGHVDGGRSWMTPMLGRHFENGIAYITGKEIVIHHDDEEEGSEDCPCVHFQAWSFKGEPLPFEAYIFSDRAPRFWHDDPRHVEGSYEGWQACRIQHKPRREALEGRIASHAPED